MIKLIDIALPATATAKLLAYQKNIDGKATFAAQVSEAKLKFKSYNKKGNATFNEIKTKLTTMCCGPERCNYCEDSKADEVEHISPKDWYPDQCFVWKNYCYACGPCNGPKNNKYTVFKDSDGSFFELQREIGAPVLSPEPGESVLINPREEDPFDFLLLDLATTFFFVPSEDDEHSKNYIRSQYTIDILGLNSISYLVKARKNAFGNYKGRLRDYITERDKGANQVQLDEMINQIKEEHHQTVWQEMIRQRRLHPALNALFTEAPEAIAWV